VTKSAPSTASSACATRYGQSKCSFPGEALVETEWQEHVAAIIRVYREIPKTKRGHRPLAATEETAHYNLTPLEVHHHGPVTLAFPPAPVVDAQHANIAADAAGGSSFQMPENRVVARRHAETLHQPLTWLTPGAMREQLKQMADTQGSTSMSDSDAGKLVRKGLSIACIISATPTRVIRSFNVTIAPCTGKSCR
jgi:hypothetical protein